MNQLDLSCYSKKDLPNILVYIELILTLIPQHYNLTLFISS